MTGGGRGGQSGDPGGGATSLLDAYVDGQLAGPARAAFEARLAHDPLLASEFELQRQMDCSLRGLYVAGPFPGVPTNGHPTAPPAQPKPGPNGSPVAPAAARARFGRWAAVAAVLVLAVSASAGWLIYNAIANHRVEFAEVYREEFLTGVPPTPNPPAATQAITTAATQKFEQACYDAFGRILQLKSFPTGLELQGARVVPLMSGATVMLRARMDGEGVLVFVDRLSNDDGGARARSASGCGNGCCGVRVFRHQLADLVLYEMTPRDEPSVLPALDFPPAPPSSCGTTGPAAHEDGAI